MTSLRAPLLYTTALHIALLGLAACGSDDDGGGSDVATPTPSVSVSPTPSPTPAPCGNDAIDDGEDCDGSDLQGASCRTEGFAGGNLGCTDDCEYDTSACLAEICGDDARTGDEICDGDAFGDASCITEGFLGGDLGCTDDCTLDTSACLRSICGNGSIEAPLEDCDGDALGDATCESLGFGGGTLSCADDCFFDTTGCERAETCPEVDIGSRVGPRAFIGTNAGAGNDFDSPSCARFSSQGDDITVAWTAPSTGTFYVDIEGTEFPEPLLSVRAGCDGEELACDTRPSGPNLTFEATQGEGYLFIVDTLFETGTVHLNIYPPATCGDGKADPPEPCDGEDLVGATCESLGFDGGTLACNATCDGFDASGCEGGLTCPVEDLGSAVGTSLSAGLAWGNDNSSVFSGSCGLVSEEPQERTFSWTAPEDGTYLVDTRGSGNETKIYARAGGCFGPEVACSDWGDVEGMSLDDVRAGDTFTLFVESYGNVGNYVLNIKRTVCGDEVLDLNEACDLGNTGGETCEDLGYVSGTLGCSDDCKRLDESACVPPTCGDGVIEGWEICDGDNLAGTTCNTLGGWGGTLRCGDDCREYDRSGCERCGNGVRESIEQCDPGGNEGIDFGGATCESLGLGDGELDCQPFICSYDTSGCSASAVCGDGELAHPEACDGELMGTPIWGDSPYACTDFGYEGGELGCEFCQLDFSGCTGGRGHTTCGNGRRDFDEACDGDDFIFGPECAQYFPTLGAGQVTCRDDCTLDYGACENPDRCDAEGLYDDGRLCQPCERMGGTPDPDCELCGLADGLCPTVVEAGVVSCRALGKPDPDCDPCGNGRAGTLANTFGFDFDVENCDGTDLSLRTCEAFGYTGGLLRCLPSCIFDFSQCEQEIVDEPPPDDGPPVD